MKRPPAGPSSSSPCPITDGRVSTPATIRKKLHQFQEAHVDQGILLNQAGKTSHEDICGSLKMFAEEVMPEFHALEADHAQWKDDVLSGRLVLEDLGTQAYDIFSHQNADIVRLTPEELKARMAAKDAAQKEASVTPAP